MEKKKTILEQLKAIDKRRFEQNKPYYGLAVLYEAVKLSPQDKEEVRKVLQNTNDAETVAAVLQAKAAETNESFDDDTLNEIYVPGLLNEPDYEIVRRYHIGDFMTSQVFDKIIGYRNRNANVNVKAIKTPEKLYAYYYLAKKLDYPALEDDIRLIAQTKDIISEDALDDIDSYFEGGAISVISNNDLGESLTEDVESNPVNISNFKFTNYRNPDGQSRRGYETYRSALENVSKEIEKYKDRVIKTYCGNMPPAQQFRIECQNIFRHSAVRDIVGARAEQGLRDAWSALHRRADYLAKELEKYGKWDSTKRYWVAESLKEGIDVKSTGKTRMPLYMARDAIKKFNEDAKAYPYWVIKTDRWYDPEGLNIPNKDYAIEYAGTYDECNDKLSQLRNSVDNDWICLDKTGKDFVTLYYPHAIAKSTFSIIKNLFLGELKEDTIKQNGKWVNKGKEGTHGKFATKKAADAQRKAMFANGYTEGLNEWAGDLDADKFYNEVVKSFKLFITEPKVRKARLNGDDYGPGLMDKLFYKNYPAELLDEFIQGGYYINEQRWYDIEDRDDIKKMYSTAAHRAEQDLMDGKYGWFSPNMDLTKIFTPEEAEIASRVYGTKVNESLKEDFDSDSESDEELHADDYVVANDDIQFDTAENLMDVFGEDSEYLQKLYDLGLDDASGDFYIPEGTRLKFVGETARENDGSTLYQLQIDGDPNKEILVCDYTVEGAVEDNKMSIDRSGTLEESLLQELHDDHEFIRRAYGQEVYDALDDYCEKGHDLGDVMYREAEWNKFVKYCNKLGIPVKELHEDFCEDKNCTWEITYGQGRPGGEKEVVKLPSYSAARRYAVDNAHGWGYEIKNITVNEALTEMARKADWLNPKLRYGAKVKIKPSKDLRNDPMLDQQKLAEVTGKIGTVTKWWKEYISARSIVTMIDVEVDGEHWTFGPQDLVAVKDDDNKSKDKASWGYEIVGENDAFGEGFSETGFASSDEAGNAARNNLSNGEKYRVFKESLTEADDINQDDLDDTFADDVSFEDDTPDYEEDNDEYVTDDEYIPDEDKLSVDDDFDADDEYGTARPKKLGTFHNDNGNEYKIIDRSESGKNALLRRGSQWIIAWNCPESNEGSWGQGHYFFDEDEARQIWDDKYLKESYNSKRLHKKLNESTEHDTLAKEIKRAVEKRASSGMNYDAVVGFIINQLAKTDEAQVKNLVDGISKAIGVKPTSYNVGGIKKLMGTMLRKNYSNADVFKVFVPFVSAPILQRTLNAVNRTPVKESLSSKDNEELLNAIQYVYGFDKKNAEKWIKSASEKSKEKVLDGYRESLKEDYQHDDDDWGKPYTYEDIEDQLRTITQNWKDTQGQVRTHWSEEKDYGVLALKKRYKIVEVSDGRTGPGEEMSWVIAYAEPKEDVV